MVGILGDQHMREQTRSRQSAIDRPRWCGCLHDAVASIAAQLRTHMPDDLEAGPHVLQHLGDVFAELAEPATAVGASVVLWHVRMNFAREMLGQWAAKGLGWHGTFCRSGPQLFDGAGNLQVFKLELKLFDLAEHLLALRAEEHPLELLDQQHQAFDLAGSRRESRGVPVGNGARDAFWSLLQKQTA